MFYCAVVRRYNGGMKTKNGWSGNHTWGMGGPGMQGAGGAVAVTLLRDVPLPLDVLGDLLVGRLWGARRTGKRAWSDDGDANDDNAPFGGGATASRAGLLARRLAPGALAVLRELLRHLGAHSNRVWPSQARIAERTGLSHASVERGIAALKANGWIRCCNGAGNGGDAGMEAAQPGPRPRSPHDSRPRYCAVNCYDLSALLALVPSFLRVRPAAPPAPSQAARKDEDKNRASDPFAPKVAGAGRAQGAFLRGSLVAGAGGRRVKSVFGPHFCGTEAEMPPPCGGFTPPTGRDSGLPLSGVVVIDNNNNKESSRLNRIAGADNANASLTVKAGGGPSEQGGGAGGGDYPPDKREGEEAENREGHENEIGAATDWETEFPDPFSDPDPAHSRPASAPPAPLSIGDAGASVSALAPAPPVDSPLIADLLAFRVAPKIARRLLAERGEAAVAQCVRVARRQRRPVGPGWIVAALTENWEWDGKNAAPRPSENRTAPTRPEQKNAPRPLAPPHDAPRTDPLLSLAPNEHAALEAQARAAIVAETPLWGRPGGPPLPRAAVQGRMRALLAAAAETGAAREKDEG